MGKQNSSSILLMASTLLGSLSWAQSRSLPMSVNSTSAGENAISAPASGLVTRSGNSTITFKINNSCFPTNLRSVENPLAANSTIIATVNFTVGTKTYEVKLSYPGGLVGREGIVGSVVSNNPTVSSTPSGAKGVIYGNSALINTPFPTSVSIDSGGNIIEADKGAVYLNKATFVQKVNSCSSKVAVYGSMGISMTTPTYACGEFMGKDGPLAVSIGSLNVSSDKSNIELNVSFPGETGFCGGYWSPLMVFFDEKRPEFMNISSFPLNPFGKTFWPVKDHTGFFVAVDRDGSGKIDQRNELFGDNGEVKNGFEILKEFDSNQDGLVDKRDQDFKKLVLWQDKNGDGISQAEELIKLSGRIMKISLNYKNDSVVPLGAYAEERQRSKFWYKAAKGRIKTGEIIDIWLAPAQETTVTQK